MTALSLGTAWNEAVAFVKREGRLLFPIGFLLVALPIAVASSLVPQVQPGQVPPLGAWTPLMAAAFAIGMVGQVAIAFLVLRRGASVAEALARGGRRLLPLLGGYLLVSLGFAVAIFLFAIVAAVVGGGAAPPDPQSAGLLVVLMALLMLPLILFVGTRLMLVNAVAAAESGSSIAILKRSWLLTGRHFWQLLGFVFLTFILAAVVTFATERVFGVAVFALAGPPRSGNLSAVLILLIGAAINTLVTVFVTTMIARIYAQLVPDSQAEVFV